MKRCEVVLKAKVTEYKHLQDLERWIPANTLCGRADTIPGLLHNQFPLKAKDVVPVLDVDVYINSSMLKMSRRIEEEFMRQAGSHSGQTPRGEHSMLKGLTIHEKRVTVLTHNTWKLVNNGDSAVLPSRPDSNGYFKAKGHLCLENFWIDPKVVVLFKLEFICKRQQVQSSMGRDRRMRAMQKTSYENITIAWGLFIPNIGASGAILDEKLEVEMCLGPGKTPDGQVLWNPKMGSLTPPIVLRAGVSTREPKNQTFNATHGGGMHASTFGREEDLENAL